MFAIEGGRQTRLTVDGQSARNTLAAFAQFPRLEKPMHPKSNPHVGVDYLRFTRPSRHGAAPHRVTVDARTLRPVGCSCRAGQFAIVCHAALSVAIDELVPIALARWTVAKGFLELEAAAALYGRTLRYRATAAALLAQRCEHDAREVEHWRDPDAPCGYVVVKPEEVVA